MSVRDSTVPFVGQFIDPPTPDFFRSGKCVQIPTGFSIAGVVAYIYAIYFYDDEVAEVHNVENLHHQQWG